MLPLFAGLLFLISISLFALQFFAILRSLNAVAEARKPLGEANRYRPMLRLLSDDDLTFVSGNKTLARRIRGERREIFRGYLRCLTKDYGRLLAGVRLAMVNSTVDRPDLARALARNKMLFVMALYRIEIRLLMHTLGIGKVDVSGLVEAMDTLRNQVGFLAPASFPA
jgi:hypothetical protein